MLEKVKAGINKGILSASVNSGTYLEIEKIKGKIASEEKEIISMLDELGRLVYERWKDEKLDLSELGKYCQVVEEKKANIDACQLEIERLEVERNRILGKDKTKAAVSLQTNCSQCGSINPSGGKFCLQCGTELIDEEIRKENIQNDEDIKICSCGNRCKNTDKFCMRCGKEL